ncbi:HAD hydrolase family protein [bacterium]|nr:HAD hydrolase family protein [bacterium]
MMCDVDNCIIDADGKISKETDKALRELINVPGHAYYFGMMSYRPVMQVKKIYDTMELRPTSYLIGTKGAEVYSLSSDQFMIHQFIDSKTAQKIYDELIEISKHNSKLAFHVSYDGV